MSSPEFEALLKEIKRERKSLRTRHQSGLITAQKARALVTTPAEGAMVDMMEGFHTRMLAVLDGDIDD